MKKNMTTVTVMLIAVLLASTFLAGEIRVEPFDIGDFSGVDAAQAEQRFAQTGTSEDLVALVNVLCWRYKVAGEEAAAAPLKAYGQQLLDRAKEETVDLETVGDPEVMLKVLRVIRELGAR